MLFGITNVALDELQSVFYVLIMWFGYIVVLELVYEKIHLESQEIIVHFPI